MTTAEWMLKNKIDKWIIRNEVKKTKWKSTHYCPQCNCQVRLTQDEVDDAEGFVHCDNHDVTLQEI